MVSDAGPPTVQGLKARRERLEVAADELERAITRAAGDPGRWCGGVRAALEEIRAALVVHAESVEAPGGLFDEVASKSPRLIHSVDQLRLDHRHMEEQITELEDHLTADDVAVDATREGALVLLLELSRHRHRGADLLWEFYDVDIGGGG